MADILLDTRRKNIEKPLRVIVTHGDADGLVSALIVTEFEKIIDDIDKDFVVVSGMDVSEEQTEKTFNYLFKYMTLGTRDKIYILDRPIPNTGWLSMGYLSNTSVISIDHHVTNNPDIFQEHSSTKDIKGHWALDKSAAYLSLEYFKEYADISEKCKVLYDKLSPLAIATSFWDIFTWKSLSDEGEEKKLKDRALSINSAEKILGSIAFYKIINTNIESENYSDNLFKYFEICDVAYQCNLENIYNFTMRCMEDHKYKNYKMGVVYGVDLDYQSIISDKIFSEKKYNYEIIAFVNIFGTVSFRSKGDIDVSSLAKNLGEISGFSGGGHRNAAGCKIYDKRKIKETILEIFYNNIQKL